MTSAGSRRRVDVRPWIGRRVTPALWIVGSIAVVAIPFMGLPPIWPAAMLLALVYIPAALGQNLILGNAGLLAMGQAAFCAVGAYTTGILAINGFDGLLALLVGFLLSGVLGVLVGIPALRIGGDYLFVVSLGFNLIVVDIVLQWQGVTGGGTGLVGIPTLTAFGYDLGAGPQFYVVVALIVAAACAATQFLSTSRFGLTVEALRDDRAAATAVGIRLSGPFMAIFGIGSALAGLTGGLLCFTLGYVGPQSFSVATSILIFQMAVIGGLASVPGSVAGAMIIILIPEIFRFLQPVRDLLAGVFIIVLMIVRPEGLFGKAKITNLIKK